MLTKCIWCNQKPIHIKKSLLCEKCHLTYRAIGVPELSYKQKDKPAITKKRTPSILKPGQRYCIQCNLRPVAIKKRGLCNNCYAALRVKGLLPPLPKKTLSESNWYQRQSLIKRYGKNIIKDFEQLKNNYGWTLERLGEKYGFTREYARQAYEFVFDEKYTEKIEHFKEVRSNDIETCPNDPRHKFADYKRNGSNVWKSAKTEKMFFDECEKRNLNPQILCTRTIDIKVNGHLIDVKSSFTASLFGLGSKTPYMRFGISKKQRKKCDFIACYHGLKKVFFIIPKEAMTKSNMIYISKEQSDYCNARNRYWEYKDAWHLLKHTTPDTGQ